MERTAQLISEYLDGELDDAGVELLADALRSEPIAIERLVLTSFIHAQMYQWMNVRQLRDELLADAFGESKSSGCAADANADEDRLIELTDNLTLGHATASWQRRHWISMVTGLATMLLVVVSIVATTYVMVARPAIVAQLTEEELCVWKAGTENVPVGALLREGQTLQLASGRALVTFECGAQMMVAGPAVVQFRSTSAAALTEGRVGARVPSHAIGFTVATPAVDFVDLGTEFTVALQADDSCELQVFDGLVEMRVLSDDRHSVAERLKISEGSAVRFVAERRDVVSIAYDEEQRLLP